MSIDSDLKPGDQVEIISCEARREAQKIAGRACRTGKVLQLHADRRFVKVKMDNYKFELLRVDPFAPEIWFSIKAVKKI